jgi:hypothetical protein
MIFTAVMVVVIAISYLSYKAKQRNSIPENSMYEETMNQNVQTLMNNAAAYSKQTVYAAPVPAYIQTARTSYTEQRRPSTGMYTGERTAQRRTTSDSNSKKRFQVVNNNSRNEFLTNLQPSSIGGYSRTPAPEFNFLNYYSDQKDDKLTSIAMDRYKNYR